ncbi:MAG: InlB B-repeat-containing protein [Dehalococcoidales bacterium]
MGKRRDLYYKLALLALSLMLIMPMLSACNVLKLNGSSGGTTAITATAETEIYNNGNIAGVINNPTGGPTTFTITGSYDITLITDYHWNNGQGASAGTIGLTDTNGNVIGTWPVTVRSGVYWDAEPNTIIGPGTYTVVDSDPSTWAQNSQSSNQGITDIKGKSVTYVASANTTNSSTNNTTQSTGTKNTQPPMDVTADKASATVGQNGGELDLKNGAKLVVPAGALNANAALQINQLSNPVDFGADTTAYDITGLNQATSAVTLTFPVTKGLTSDEVNVCTYDMTSQQIGAIPYKYDAAGNTVTVTIDPNTISSDSIKPHTVLPIVASVLEPLFKLFKPNYSILERLEILFTPEQPYTAQSPQHIIATPYYEQSGGSCWAADTMMLIRSYDTAPAIQRNLGDALYACNDAGVSLADFGLDAYGFETNLASYISGQTGATVTWRGYYNIDSLQAEILKQLDLNHPLIIHLPGIGHYDLITGYKSDGAVLIIQDSNGLEPNSADQPNLGGMNFVRTFDWIRSLDTGVGNNLLVPLQILWVDKAVTTNCTLQTIECPGAGDAGTYSCPYGNIDFYAINPKVTSNNKLVYGFLQFDPSQVDGYSWYGTKKTPISTIPSNVTNFELSMPVFNSATSEVTVTEKTLIRSETTQLDVETQSVSLPEAEDNTTSPVQVNQTIPMDKIVNPALADANGNEPVSIDVTLNQGGTVLDHFELEVNVSVLPNITSVSPAPIVPGSALAIYGSNFGAKQLSNSKVLITGKTVDIVSWTSSEIDVDVPADLDTIQGVTVLGPESVIVYTGDKYQYHSTAFVVAPATTAAKAYSISCTVNCLNGDSQLAQAAGCEVYVTGSGRAGSTSTLSVSVPSGYDFSGFTGEDDLNLTTAVKQTFVMPAHNVSLVANFTALPPD